MLQRRHILAATALHVAMLLLIIFAAEFHPRRFEPPQPRIIEAVMLDPAPAEVERAREEELAEQERERELEEQREREQEQERQRQQEEEARRRAEAEARQRRERELAEQRQREEEQRRQEEEERRQREEEERRQREEEERRQQEEEERKQREAEERRQREEEERRQREEAERRRREEEERRRAEEEARQRALQEQIEAEERAQREAAAIQAWTPGLEHHIERFWRRPPELATARDLSAVLRVTILPDGTVTAVQVVESSGNIAFDRSAQRAVEAASPLPQPDGGFFFREFRTRFQPE